MSRVAMVVSTVGYHWEELFRAYWVFHDAGYDIELYTVDGAAAQADPYSLRRTGPAALVGLGLPAHIAPTTPRGEALMAALNAVRPLATIAPDRLDTLYLPGGHGCLFDVNRNADLHDVIRSLYQRGCVLGGVCHATSTFAFVALRGKSIVAGHRMTGFPHALDRALIAAGLVHERFLPLPLVNDQVLRDAGAKLSRVDAAKACIDPRYARTSLPFITGMGPKAAGKVARRLVRAVADRQERRMGDVPAVAI